MTMTATKRRTSAARAEQTPIDEAVRSKKSEQTTPSSAVMKNKSAPSAAAGPKRIWTQKEVKDAAAAGDYVFIIEKKVYKVPPQWGKIHPGGEILLMDGKGHDITIPFLANHREEVVRPIIERFCVGQMEASYGMSKMEDDFVELVKEVQTDPRWFKASFSYYAQKVAWYALLLSAALACGALAENWWIRVVLSAILLGCYYQQVAFLGHDLGHNGVTHDRAIDTNVGYLFGNATSGIGIGWWKSTHNVHHLVTNSIEYDCDIQHMPVFAISEKCFNKFSLFHFRMFELDAVSKYLLRYQHILFYPIMGLARFNLYAQTIMLNLSSDFQKRSGGDRKQQILENACLGFYFSWLSYFSWTCVARGVWSDLLIFLLLSHGVAGLLHVQIVISHFVAPVIEGNPLDKMSFVECQLSTAVDVDCPPYMDWFHGGLQFQAVHHLIPRVPRHNLRALRDEKILPFCAKHGLEYKNASFFECNKMIYNTLKKTSTSHLLWDALNAQG